MQEQVGGFDLRMVRIPKQCLHHSCHNFGPQLCKHVPSGHSTIFSVDGVVFFVLFDNVNGGKWCVVCTVDVNRYSMVDSAVHSPFATSVLLDFYRWGQWFSILSA